MPRKKATTATTRTKPDPSVPMIARYLCLAIAEYQTLIGEGRQPAADKLKLEIEEQLAFRFRGEALMTLNTLVTWIGDRAKDFASIQGIGVSVVEPYADFAPEGGGPIIDHE